MGGSFFGKSDLNGVAVARHGLILWENDATRSTNLFKYVLDLKIEFLILKIQKKVQKYA